MSEATTDLPELAGPTLVAADQIFGDRLPLAERFVAAAAAYRQRKAE